MSKRSWLIFGAVQIVGCILAGVGTVYSESAFVRGSWLCGFLLLLPGNLPAMALSQTLVHVRTAYIFFPVVVACNATLWVSDQCWSWMTVRQFVRPFANSSTCEGDFEVCGQAENGREAVEKALLLQPALIVTDLSMPLMNGLEETRILRKLMPSVPVIIYSAHIDSFMEKEAQRAGASAVVSKSEAVAVLIDTSPLSVSAPRASALIPIVECLPAGIQLFNKLVKKLRESVRVRFFGDALTEMSPLFLNLFDAHSLLKASTLPPTKT